MMFTSRMGTVVVLLLSVLSVARSSAPETPLSPSLSAPSPLKPSNRSTTTSSGGAPSASGKHPEGDDPVTFTTTTSSTTPVTDRDEDDCMDQIEYYNNDELIERLKKYDVAQALRDLGGAPGEVNATWQLDDVPELEVVNATERPLPDTDNHTFWLYDYRSTDWKTYVRLEHALVRHKGTPGEFIDVRGELWWAPTDLCGELRHALYRRDDAGFHADVLRAHCHIFQGSKELSCYGPDSENECAFCIGAGVSGALIASLVG